MPHYFEVALDNGVKPREISEIITHLAFYSGWGQCDVGGGGVKPVFAERRSAPISFRPLRPRSYRSIRQPSRNGRQALSSSSETLLLELCSTPRMSCSGICGFAPT